MVYDLDFELTEEDLQIAESNGISRRLAKKRYYVGMDKEKAITMPRRTGRLKRLHEQALKNGVGIHYDSFTRRLRAGMSEEDAITIPNMSGGKKPNELVDLAKENGIKAVTYWARRRRGWTKERAATEPVQSQFNWRGKDG